MSETRIQEEFDYCNRTVLTLPLPPEGKIYCPRTFDGWGCWNDTLAGAVAFINCPIFVPGFNPERKAFKVCQEDGSWFTHPETNKTWSNYTTCVDQEDLSFRQKINNFYIFGYSVSLIALLISLAIFFSFSSLKCDRITIHKNLFISFIINNTFWIIWYVFVIFNPEILVENGYGCQALHVLVQYFLVCNYFWMFCEGLYLHTLLVVAFVSEEKILKWFYAMGWGIPLIIIIIYASFRGSSETDTVFCWIEDSKYTSITTIPVCVSILLNLFFLINIVRVLVTKLRAVNSPDTHQTRKAVRATLILIPLLGLQYVLMPFRPPPGSPGEFFYEMISAAFTSFQGLCVAMLFCFCNGEVLNQIKKKWSNIQWIQSCKSNVMSVNNNRSVNHSESHVLRRLSSYAPVTGTSTASCTPLVSTYTQSPSSSPFTNPSVGNNNLLNVSNNSLEPLRNGGSPMLTHITDCPA